MKKKSLVSILIFVLIAAMGTFSLSYATSVSDKQDELDSINQQKDDVSSDMNALTSSIKEQQAEIDRLQGTMDKKQSEINEAERDIEETKRNIEERQDGLDNRLRTMYKNGSVGFLDVLLGSNSISEFISNLEMIQRIYKNDQNTLTTLEEQHQELEEKQTALKNEKAELSEQKAVAEEKQSALQSDKEKLQKKLDELNAEADKVSSEIAGLQDQSIQRRQIHLAYYIEYDHFTLWL